MKNVIELIIGAFQVFIMLIYLFILDEDTKRISIFKITIFLLICSFLYYMEWLFWLLFLIFLLIVTCAIIFVGLIYAFKFDAEAKKERGEHDTFDFPAYKEIREKGD